ncbi:MAG: ATP-dependent helicase [Lachnospiraceae bacterium]|nr:ATP-dependent helicase [Lachnospiraceae bacterium]
MYTQGLTEEAFITTLQAKLYLDYTEEQKTLISKFGTGPVFCFADPGTGKTYTAVGGLIFAELFRQIPGDSIYAMSFTNMATGELMARHTRACDKLGISKLVHFSTLHSLCRQILAENYRKLGMASFGRVSKLTMAQSFKLVEDSCVEWGLSVDPKTIRAVIRACESLNSALIFDEDNVRTKMAFKECNVDYWIFDKIRGLLFSYSLLVENINVSDIMLYTLMLMEKFPEVSTQFKAKCRLMLIDEAQDLSLLHLRIISMLTDNPVFIGDMKQQIYAFNGACQEIVQAFFEHYPNASTTKLTQSFRCKNEIAEFATKIILHNNIGGEDFTGNGEGGVVKVHCADIENDSPYSLPNLCESLRKDFIANHNKFPVDYLFLFRNNSSAVPIVEELFKRGLPFRVNRYLPAYDVPVIKEMCEILRLCESPASLDNIMAMRYLIPEFRAYRDLKSHPFYEICRKTGQSVFEINYEFKNPGDGYDAMTVMVNLREKMLAGATVSDLFNTMWRLYEEQWVKPNMWRLEADVDYYINSVADLTREKNYQQFIQDEIKKQAIIKDSELHSRGVRCYTMHASKGLEADVVYILDADDGLIPNVKKLDRMVKRKCDMDAARAIREERSLCYVACTRARNELHIVYNNKPAVTLLGENPYGNFDDIYRYYSAKGNDISAFNKFVEDYVTL